MTISPAVRQAIDLLVGRRDELAAELSEVSAALRALGHDTATPSSELHVADRAVTPDARSNGYQLRPSVRTAVLELLDSAPRNYHLEEVVDTLRPQYQDRQVEKFRPNVRSALYQLKKDGAVFNLTRGQYRSAKWPQNAESPASTGLSDLSALATKGGEGSVGQGVPADVVGEDHSGSDTHASGPDRGAAVEGGSLTSTE